jgi:hypothetical protein
MTTPTTHPALTTPDGMALTYMNGQPCRLNDDVRDVHTDAIGRVLGTDDDRLLVFVDGAAAGGIGLPRGVQRWLTNQTTLHVTSRGGGWYRAFDAAAAALASQDRSGISADDDVSRQPTDDPTVLHLTSRATLPTGEAKRLAGLFAAIVLEATGETADTIARALQQFYAHTRERSAAEVVRLAGHCGDQPGDANRSGGDYAPMLASAHESLQTAVAREQYHYEVLVGKSAGYGWTLDAKALESVIDRLR